MIVPFRLLAALVLLAAVPVAANPVRDLPCTDCHGTLTMAHRHPPVVEDCRNCHDDHFTPDSLPFLLLDGLNDLCLGCHDDPEDTGGHPVAGHPTCGPKDPYRPGRAFTCVSCHNPHQSPVPALIRYPYPPELGMDDGYPCVLCHAAKMNIPPPPITHLPDPLRQRVQAVSR